jgi:SAM-dependent methyltransferase
MYEYSADFYRYLASFAARSARAVVPRLTAFLPVRSVVDFGCGQGAWLSVWRSTGASVVGVDGPYVDPNRLLIDAAAFHAADLAQPIDLGRRFDLVQSLEVAEHLPAARAEQFIATLTAHGPCVLFSAAIPGQGGENHINEQPPGYWRAIFRKRGYVAIDCLRPQLVNDPAVERSYRYNMMLYVTEPHLASLPEAVRACRVRDGEALVDYRPFSYRLQNAVVRRLPLEAVNRLARLKASLAATGAHRAAPSGVGGQADQQDPERDKGDPDPARRRDRLAED